MITRPDFEKKQILFVFPNQGDKMSFKNDNIVIVDSDKKIKHQSTCYRLFMVCIVGDITLTTGIIRRSRKFGFTICLMTSSMKLYQILGSTMEGNTLLHKKQYTYSGLSIARHLVKNKINNQKLAIKKLRIKTDDAKDVIASLENFANRTEECNELSELLGLEGNSAKLYFREVFSTVDWKGRQPRIKSDYINCSLDIGYTILFNFIDALLGIYDFDTYYGVLHKNFYMRKSIVCDIMEPFRPIIDLKTRKSINYGQINEDLFQIDNKRVELSWKHSTKVTQLYLEAILERKDEIFLYIQGYYRAFMKGIDTDDFPDFVM